MSFLLNGMLIQIFVSSHELSLQINQTVERFKNEHIEKVMNSQIAFPTKVTKDQLQAAVQ